MLSESVTISCGVLALASHEPCVLLALRLAQHTSKPTLDETDDAAERYDLKTMMMQLSAFAANEAGVAHGQAWQAVHDRRGEAVAWRVMQTDKLFVCSFVSVLVDSQGKAFI